MLREFRSRLQRALPGALHEVRLFGSRARGEARPDSDWDLAVVVAPELATDTAVRDVVSDTAFDFLMQGWPIHTLVIGSTALGAGAETRADAIGEVARHGVRIG
jgi:predicted nucleotidyltransferase